MITSEIKDRVLSDFVLYPEGKAISVPDEALKYGIDRPTFTSLLLYYNRHCFIEAAGDFSGILRVIPTVEAHDVLRLGGFVAQEELLKANIQKLGLEIDLLSKELASSNLLEKAQRIASLGNSILSFLDRIV